MKNAERGRWKRVEEGCRAAIRKMKQSMQECGSDSIEEITSQVGRFHICLPLRAFEMYQYTLTCSITLSMAKGERLQPTFLQTRRPVKIQVLALGMVSRV